MERFFYINQCEIEKDYVLCVEDENNNTVATRICKTLYQALEAIGNYVEYNDIKSSEIVIRKNESK